VIEGEGKREEIKTMPGVYRLSIDQLVPEIKIAESLGIKAVALFPYIDQSLKSEDAKEAYNKDNLICRAIKSIKDSGVGIGIICDVALDPYTSDGHDGVLINGQVDNDFNLDILTKQSIALADAGADILAPSDMMDGRILVIREALESEGKCNVGLISYSAKYASSFYAPFRDAVGSSANLKSASKASYQMDPRNAKEAIREIILDIEEGADIVMVKPGILYLDIIKEASMTFNIPIFAYQVSGEYASIKYASLAGALDYQSAMIESLISLKRAGASGIFTYGALEIANSL
jgi:porphobilinogen synthase